MWGTATGLLALLTEKNDQLKIYGLQSLHMIIEDEWPQIADELEPKKDSLIIKLANDKKFPDYKSAALLASKIYYHLGKLDEAIDNAIKAGEKFDTREQDEYTLTIVAHAVKQYIKMKQNSKEDITKEDLKDGIKEDHKESPPEFKISDLLRIVESVLQNLLEQNRYSACLCIAIETRSNSFVQATLKQQPSLVTDAIILTMNTVKDSEYRQKLLQLFVQFAVKNCEKFQLSQLYHALSEPKCVADLLVELWSSKIEDNLLLAFQIAFELAENASQKFRSDVITDLRERKNFDETSKSKMENILTRKTLLDLYLQFLFKKNKTDIHIIVKLKETLDNTRMLVHSSVITAYCFMFAGTGDDNFYRNNTPYFSNGRKWSQFMTIAGVGAIHIGHLKAALQVLQPFLSKGTPSYAYGGGLYALGLIYANYSWDSRVVDTVLNAFKTPAQNSFVVRHGGCLALGLIMMGSQEEKYYDIAHNILMDEATQNSNDKAYPEAGEAAGYAIGMIMLGCGPNERIQELVDIATKCQHEKVTRGIAMALALMMYGKEELSDTLVESLQSSRIPLLRESAAWVTALAFVGTSSNAALQRLLHLAVSDVNPDVRRAAVIGVGFVLSRSPKEVPSMVNLLAESYHPHVRSGAALALGIACAGTGMPEAIAILEPLLDDLEDFVKQSAMIAMAMVLQQQSDESTKYGSPPVPYTKKFRAYLRKLINKKRNELQVFGLCLAYGILNAGGRNVVISCNSLRGENSVLATTALALFCNYFYWQPLALMLPLSFHPTAVIGLDKDLNLPKWEIYSEGKKKLYANPPSFESEKEVVTSSKTTSLSANRGITAANYAAANAAEAAQAAAELAEKQKRKEEEEEEDDYEILENPSRVTLNQLSHINIRYSKTYRPITKKPFHGFVMLKEINPEEEEEED